MSSMSGQLQKQIADALKRQDAAKAGRLADRMRFDYGFRYADIMKQVALAGFEPADWEELMYEADGLESRG
jgi:hypothetical protein